MLMLDTDQVACDARLLLCAGDGAENFPGVFLHARFVLSWRVLDHPAVGREGMKGRQDRQHGNFGTEPAGQRDAVLDCLRCEFRPIGRYQYVGIHRRLLGYDLARNLA
jgi:hypothetical protein